MKQHALQTDPVSAQYSTGLEQIWYDWEPSLRAVERVLHGAPVAIGREGTEQADALRRAQYRAHTAAEFASGLVPPLAASDAHEYLLDSLDDCREALGVLAIRADLDDLDDDAMRFGLQATQMTREAFTAARRYHSTAQAFDQSMTEVYFDSVHAHTGSRAVAWVLVSIAAIACASIAFELMLMLPPAH